LGLTFGDRYNNIDANIDEGDDIDAFTNNPDDEESTGVNDDIQLEDNVNQQLLIDLPDDDILLDLPDLQTPVFEYDSVMTRIKTRILRQL